MILCPRRGRPYRPASIRALPARTATNGRGKTPDGRAPRKPPAEPIVKLGQIAHNGICASMFGLLERGASLRPKIARGLRGEVLIRFTEDFAPIRIRFERGLITVEDMREGDEADADLVITGSLVDIVQLASAPLIGGVPKPTTKTGRAALARVAVRQVRIEGSPLLARRLLKLLEI